MNINKHLKEANAHILNQLSSIVDEMSDVDYATKLTVLNGSSIGMHIRHIIEFYTCLLDNDGTINYDKRKRDLRIETETDFAVSTIGKIVETISLMDKDQLFSLSATASYIDDEYNMTTTLSRELNYLVEHSIHHMAIIKIAIQDSFNHMELQPHFGIAFTTIKHQEHVHSNILSNK